MENKPRSKSMVCLAVAAASLFFNSCTKDKCAGVSCLNGGTCNNGSCVCPPGYTGSSCESIAVTSVTYVNNAFTPVHLSVNGSAYTIQPGASQEITGSYGSAVSATANTSGVSSTGAQIGGLMTWAFNSTFPASGTTIQTIDVPGKYFFLKIQNNSSVNGSGIYVNYGTVAQTFDNVGTPNGGATYLVGYYNAYTNTEVYLTGGFGLAWTYYPAFSFLNNQSFTAIMN